MFEKFFSRETLPPIHPDFKIKGDVYDNEKDLRWSWNWVELKLSPNRKKYAQAIKLAFPFEDVGLMDSCPFMCKIGENIGENKETKYYGVAYATEEDTQALIDWGQKFPHAKLITGLEPFSDGTTRNSKIEYVK